MMYRLAKRFVRRTAGDKIIQLHGIDLDNTYGSVRQVQVLLCNLTAK